MRRVHVPWPGSTPGEVRSRHQLTQTTVGSTTTTMVYDADGNRLLRREPAEQWLYLDGLELRNQNGQLRGHRSYTLAGTTVALKKGANLFWTGGNHQGTLTVTLLDGTTNTATERYGPWGRLRSSATIIATEHGFLNQTEDPTTGLVYLNNRYYDPKLRRFTSTDPLSTPANPQGLNPYSYANNNPTTYSDPTGLLPTCPRMPEDNGRCAPATRPDPVPSPVRAWCHTMCPAGPTPADSLAGRLPERHANLRVGDPLPTPPGGVFPYELPISGLNLEERAWCQSHLPTCMTVSALADIATEQFGRTGTDYTNAKKHMFWSALLTLTFDGEFAREVTDRHENLAPYLGEVIGFDTAMDLINSEVGISIGEEIKLRHQTRPVETAYDLLPDYREIDAMMTVALVENRAVLLTWNESKG